MQDLLFIGGFALCAVIAVPLINLLKNAAASQLHTDAAPLTNTQLAHDHDDESVFKDVSGAGNEKLGAVADHEGYF